MLHVTAPHFGEKYFACLARPTLEVPVRYTIGGPRVNFAMQVNSIALKESPEKSLLNLAAHWLRIQMTFSFPTPDKFFFFPFFKEIGDTLLQRPRPHPKTENS